MKKRNLLISLLTLSLLVGCGQPVTSEEPSSSEPQEATILDHIGNNLNEMPPPDKPYEIRGNSLITNSGGGTEHYRI